jgi:hypothetical protein
MTCLPFLYSDCITYHRVARANLPSHRLIYLFLSAPLERTPYRLGGLPGAGGRSPSPAVPGPQCRQQQGGEGLPGVPLRVRLRGRQRRAEQPAGRHEGSHVVQVTTHDVTSQLFQCSHTHPPLSQCLFETDELYPCSIPCRRQNASKWSLELADRSRRAHKDAEQVPADCYLLYFTDCVGLYRIDDCSFKHIIWSADMFCSVLCCSVNRFSYATQLLWTRKWQS